MVQANRCESRRRWGGEGGGRGGVDPRGAGRIESRFSFDVLEERIVLATRIVTIGDSWAWLIANGAPGSAPVAPGYSNSMQNMLNTFHPGVTVANESFGGGTAAQHAAMLADITARINAHPDADIVWLSTGGNDMLLGAAGGGWVRGSANNPNVYAAIATNATTIVNHILSLRPDIQVVIEGYDYANFWDTISGSNADLLRGNLGIVKSGNVVIDGIQNADLNQGFRDAEQGKINLGSGSRRVHHIYNFGYLTSMVGYTGYFGNWPGQGFYPPDQYGVLPTRASLMGANDPIHLNSSGYSSLVLRAEQEFFDTALANASLSVGTTTLGFGDTRVGTLASLGTSASNAGPDFTKVKNLAFQVGTGAFGGGGSGYNPLFKDPTLGSDVVTASYTFAPTARGVASQNRSVTSDSGSATLALSGRGVAPILSSVSTLDFGSSSVSGTRNLGFSVDNVTPDGNLGGLTDLTVLGHQIVGANANLFALAGLNGATVVHAGSSLGLNVAFDGTVAPGTYAATLQLFTDEGAALGGAGNVYSIQLVAVVTSSAPTALPGGPYTGVEGLAVLLLGSGTGTINTYAWDLDNNGSYETVGQNVSFAPSDSGHYVVGLQVSGPGGSASAQATVDIGNLAPTAGIAGQSSAARGEPVKFTLSASDPSPADQAANFTFAIDWDGNGSVDQAVVGPSGTQVTRVFATTGTYNVKVTATDKDNGTSALVQHSINVVPWQLRVDPQNASLTNLYWGGTNGFDAYLFVVPGLVLVQAENNVFFGSPQAVFTGSFNGRAYVYAQGSGDLVFADVMNLPMVLDGGEGDDVLIGGRGADSITGGNGNDILFGGTLESDGADTIEGGAGDDLLVGHYGADLLKGGTGQDLIIAGRLSFVDLPGSVFGIQAEWTSGRPLADRVANLSGTGTGDRNNGDIFLIVGDTVLDDSPSPPAVVDQVFGEADDDWLLYDFADDLAPDVGAGDVSLNLG